MVKIKKNLTKKELSNNINKKIGLSKIYSDKVAEDLIDVIKTLIKKGGLNIKNFGSFKLIKKRERIGRNPKTKKEYKISARNSLSFLMSKQLMHKLDKLL